MSIATCADLNCLSGREVCIKWVNHSFMAKLIIIATGNYSSPNDILFFYYDFYCNTVKPCLKIPTGHYSFRQGASAKKWQPIGEMSCTSCHLFLLVPFPWSYFIVKQATAVFEAKLTTWNSPIESTRSPWSLLSHKSVPQVVESGQGLVHCVSQQVAFLPVSQYLLICEPVLRRSLGRYLSSSVCVCLAPAWQQSSKDNCSVRRQHYITSGWTAVFSLNMTLVHPGRGSAYGQHVHLSCLCWRERDSNKLILKKP